MSVIESDISPIRALVHLGLIELLRELFVGVVVPPAVADELNHAPKGLTSLDVNTIAFMRVQVPRDEELVAEPRRSHDPGESEALAPALELGIRRS